MKEVNENAEKFLEKLRIKASKLGLQVNTETRAGDPRDVIIQYAKDVKADMIVVGSAGHSREAKLKSTVKEGMKMLVLLEEPHVTGSISNHVVAHSPVPTMVVRKVAGAPEYEFKGTDIS
eukprot:CAMPEP_0182446798 /NCGR_PEP_ID=MMETSP1172-20130603/6334_1 /TAXON_ID=708627 /ORGANISM="Timspurckia oligopyrenoides, Strain CCMP3278" /LENGTH=119 /DNA_ID=CAMNT_0024642889 /DNA_START=180 /DNA_END=535 /DNA_ORIENTATION=+